MAKTRCPDCDARLEVDDEDAGQDVRCPNCQSVFTARPEGSTGRVSTTARRPRWDEDDDRPRRRRRRRYADDFDDEPSPSLVVAPGVALAIAGLLGLGWGAINAMGALVAPPPPPQQANQPGFMLGYWGAIVLQPIYGLVVTAAGTSMAFRKAYQFCVVGAIVAMLPCNVVCPLGLGFGIWALIALNKPEAKLLFESN